MYDLGIFVDDLSADGTAESEEDVVCGIANMATEVLIGVDSLGLQVASDKVAVLASNSTSAKRIAARLGYSGAEARRVVNLGVDLTAGRALEGAGYSSKRSKRMKEAQRRWKRATRILKKR